MKNEKEKLPKVGDIVYVPSEVYMQYGDDDLYGGKAKVWRVIDDGKDVWVVVEVYPGSKYNWKELKADQEYLKNKFGENWATKD